MYKKFFYAFIAFTLILVSCKETNKRQYDPNDPCDIQENTIQLGQCGEVMDSSFVFVVDDMSDRGKPILEEKYHRASIFLRIENTCPRYENVAQLIYYVNMSSNDSTFLNMSYSSFRVEDYEGSSSV